MFTYKKIVPFFLSFLMIAPALSYGDSRRGVVERVDNTHGVVVISDLEYKLKLNTKVKKGKGAVVNRYALKAGQSVVYKSYYKNKINYITEIAIIPKS